METKVGIVIYIHHKRRYGFIRGNDAQKLFFHESGVINPEFKELKAGNEVEYLEIESPKGMTAIGINKRN